MRKLLYITAILSLLCMVACEESELTSFSSKDAIYFELDQVDRENTDPEYWNDWMDYKGDSVSYSFGAYPEGYSKYLDKDTLWLQVNVMGQLSAVERTIDMSVNTSKSDAEVDVHYEALKENYAFKADTAHSLIPVVLYNHESLGAKPYTIYIELESNDHFDLGLEGRTVARILVYNDVIKPSIWDTKWGKYWFGEYSKVKHRIILQVNGNVPLDDYPSSSTRRAWQTLYNDYVEANEVYDENGNRLYPV